MFIFVLLIPLWTPLLHTHPSTCTFLLHRTVTYILEHTLMNEIERGKGRRERVGEGERETDGWIGTLLVYAEAKGR